MNHLAVVSTETGLHGLPENPCSLLDFHLLVLADGGVHRGTAGEREILAVVLSGRASFRAGGRSFERIGGRVDVFSGPPHAVYLPPGVDYDITATTPQATLALVSAPASLKSDPYVIDAAQTVSGQWGAANFARRFTDILTPHSQPDLPAQRLVVGETITPSGNWGTFPPHKHDTDDPPHESTHEEMYFVKLTPPEGFGIARQHDVRAGDRYYTMQDNSVVMFPSGYHSYVVAPGYTSYTLWFLAGQDRRVTWRDEPAHAWVEKAVPMLRSIG